MARFEVNCHPQCALSPQKAGSVLAAQIQEWYSGGETAFGVRRLLQEKKYEVSETSVYRHFKKHVVKIDDQMEAEERAVEAIENPQARLSDLEILERIIQKGAAALIRKETRVTPEMTMKALDLKLKLTQGSVFDAFLGAVADAMADGPAEAGDLEDPDA